MHKLAHGGLDLQLIQQTLESLVMQGLHPLAPRKIRCELFVPVRRFEEQVGGVALPFLYVSLSRSDKSP